MLVDAPPGPARSPERTWCSWQAGPTGWADAVSARLAPRRRCAPAPAPRGPTTSRPSTTRWSARATTSGRRASGWPAPGSSASRRSAPASCRGGSVEAPACAVAGCSTPGRRRRPARAGWRCCSTSAAGRAHRRRPLRPGGGGPHGLPAPAAARRRGLRLRPADLAARGAGRVHRVLPRGADDEAYESALRDWTERCLELGPFEVLAVEQGAIPMTDAPFPRRVGPRSSGSAPPGAPRDRPPATRSRPRSARRARWRRRCGRAATPSRRRRTAARHLRMDALLLRALDGGTWTAPRFFAGCSSGSRPSGCCASSTGRPPCARTSPSWRAPLGRRCCAPHSPARVRA